MESSLPCPCCSQAPREQKGNSNTLLSNRDVLALLTQKRAKPGQRSKPLKNFMCSPFITNNYAGSTCRDEGGCEAEQEQCLTYQITAPYYSMMLPFMLSDKSIMDNVKKVKELDDTNKKNKKKTSADAIKKKNEHEIFLNKHFKALKEVDTTIQLIRSCPSRRR